MRIAPLAILALLAATPAKADPLQSEEAWHRRPVTEALLPLARLDLAHDWRMAAIAPIRADFGLTLGLLGQDREGRPGPGAAALLGFSWRIGWMPPRGL